jgi:hypothetical protein
MNQSALYYPYIHIRDVNWLKTTLLLFSQVQRMLPAYAYFTPDDSAEVREFVPALLSPADLTTPRALSAQAALARRLLAEDLDFRSKYGRNATRQMLTRDDKGFQIHQRKLAEPLKDALRSTELAWHPINRELYDLNTEYVELNPRVGEAVMSTLAIAAATGEGLDIVGDRRSGQLHDYLLEKKGDEIYDVWLHPPDLQAAPRQPAAEDLFEFLVGFPCDPSTLTLKAITELREEREPLRELITRLRKLTSDIPAVDPGPRRDAYFYDMASTVLSEWRSSRGGYWRTFLGGDGLTDTSQKYMEKVAEKIVSAGEKAATEAAATTAAGSATATTAAAVGGGGAAAIVTAAFVGAAGGLAIGVVFHGLKSYFRMRSLEQNSPYRYLTLLEQKGVVFRSDLGRVARAVPHKPTPSEGITSRP